MYNILVDEPPVETTIDGVTYPINWKAPTMVALSVLIEDNPIEAMADDMEKAKFSVQQLMLFYPTMPHDVVAAMEYLVSFYQYDESASFASEKLKRESGQLDTAATRRGYEHNKRFFSFEHDSDMIASAFYQQYHIDVVELKQLHWYVFKSLFAGLTDQTIFVKAMQFRQMKISNEMSKSEKAYYRKMKRLYALPDKRPPELKDADFARALFYMR